MTDRLLLDRLVERVFGWRATPDRFMTGARGWIRRSGFRPFHDVRDALRLADALTRQYSLTSHPGGFTAEIHLRGRTGRATPGKRRGPSRWRLRRSSISRRRFPPAPHRGREGSVDPIGCLHVSRVGRSIDAQ